MNSFGIRPKSLVVTGAAYRSPASHGRLFSLTLNGAFAAAVACSAAVSDAQAADVPKIEQNRPLTMERARGTPAGSESQPARSSPETRTEAKPAGAAEISNAAQEANAHFRNKDYAKAVDAAKRYFKAGGSDPRMHGLLGMASFALNDFSTAVAELHAEVQEHETLGQAPPEDHLQLLAKAYSGLNNDTGQAWTLERLVSYYPKKEYWAELLTRVATRYGVGDRLLLDLLRLKFATGTLASAADYLQLAELALQAGFPAEARKFVEHGSRAGVLGTGPDAERHKQLGDLAIKQAAVQHRTLDESAAEARARKDKSSLLQVGFAYVTHGEYAKGLPLMEEGLRIGGGPNKQGDARLHLGIGYLLAGQKAKAIDMLKTVRGLHGSGELAKLWGLHIRQSG